MSQSSGSYVFIHGAFARPARQELMEVAAFSLGEPAGGGYRSLVRCDIPDTPQSQDEEGAPAGVSEAENLAAPTPQEVFAYLSEAFSLGQATVVMWGNMAYRFYRFAQQKQLPNPFSQTRVVDLQAAVALYSNLRTAQCKDPRSIMRWLDIPPVGDCLSRGSLPYVRAMNLVLRKLIADGWTPEATPTAVISGSEMGEQAEEMRVERWEQLREKQNNLGIERRPVPAETPAFIVLDGEHVSTRTDKFSHLIEVALVVAQRKERLGRTTYELPGEPFSSLVRFQQVNDANPYAWKITGIDPEEVRKAPPLTRVMADMASAAPWDTGVLVTWGPDDASVITQNCFRAGISSPVTEVPLIDLQRAFSRFYELSTPQVSLQNAASFAGIDTSQLNLHRAADDTLVTWHVLDRMLADGWTPQWRPWHRRQAEVV